MENKNIVCNRFALGQKQIVVDCKFNIESGKEVAKIVCVNAKPYTTASECVNSSVRFGGRVCFNIVYISEDGDLVSLNAISDYEELLEGVEVNNGNTNINLKVVDVTTPSIKANEIKLACVIDAEAVVETCEELNGFDMPDDVFCKRDMKQHLEFKSKFDCDFNLEEEFRINDDVQNILSCDVDICVKDMYSGTNFIVINGQSLYTITYYDENNVIRVFKECRPYKQEIGVEGAVKDDYIIGNVQVLNNQTKVTINAGESYNMVTVEVSAVATGSTYENSIYEKIEDIYSIKNMVDYDKKKVKHILDINNFNIEESIREMVEFNVDYENILGVNNVNIAISNSTLNGDTITIEGIISASIVYNTLEEVNSFIAEVPFVVTNSKSEYKEVSDIEVYAFVSDYDAIARNGQLEFNAKLNFYVVAQKNEECEFITGMTLLGERDPINHAIEIVIASEGQTFWDIGKMLGVSMEQIALQNPNLEEPLANGTRVVVYHGKK